MRKKTIISTASTKALKLKVLAKKKETVRRKLVVTAENLRLKAKKLAVTAKKKETVRRKLVVTARKPRLKARRLAVTAKEKESVRRRLVVTAKQLAVTAKERESVRRRLVVTAEKLAVTARERESIRRRLAVTAEKLAVTAKERESIRRRLAVTAENLSQKAKQLAVTARERESIRRRLAVTAEKLAITAKERESIRQRLAVTAENLSLKAKQLAVTAKEKESVRRRLVVTAEELRLKAKQLAVTARERESIRRRLAVTAENLSLKAKQLAETAKERESIRQRLAVTAENLSLKAKQLAVTAKEKESVRRRLVVTAEKLAVTAKERESVRQRLVVTAETLAVTAKEREEAKIATQNVLKDLSVEKSNLEIAKAKEEAILHSIGDGLIATNEKGEITLFNKRAEELIGEQSGNALGKSYLDVIIVEDEKGVPIPLENRQIYKALKEGIITSSITTEDITYYYVRKDKTKFPVAFTVAPVFLEGRTIGAIDVFRDVTKEKEIDKAKSEFITLASHQLKTPPTAIKLLTERLLGGKIGAFTPQQKEYFEDIHSSNQRMIDLVNALLNVSRIELGAFAIKVNMKDPLAIVRTILNELKPVIDKKQLKLNATYPDKNIELLLDESLFRIVVNNLLTNAIHYTQEGGSIQVVCKTVDKGQSLPGKLLSESCFVIVISDSGYGVPLKDQNKLFTKFFRADNARQRLSDGTGLGLYIVKSVLDHSGGLIWFTSKENEGSVFYVAIPMTGMRVKAVVSPQTETKAN